ncbi:quercetin 2,3-dioxygenase [Zobellella endophytica]|uniref:Quercetin 2,3-dioxygenase n=1 Tax=Zobellella endophytica TaxID=2116700 RepID=A0A2P7QWW0_9GAMM|nr:pirin family protein [Zobellella endophytica]PSJ42433.1 quercetin 2,3-dioxygenase [Zobellella endophytica]
MPSRKITALYPAMETRDGAGVRLQRALGQHQDQRMDPYLMMDHFSSIDAADYIAGFPDHPHRGFETITYMLDGHMLHQDHMGNQGHLKAGDLQWMTAGRGVIHSEMPQQEAGRMRGFQIWLNLPAALKMQPASYQDIPGASLPRAPLDGGGELILLAGELELAGQRLRGPIHSEHTRPLIADIRLAPGGGLSLPLAAELNALVYGFEGEARIAGQVLSGEHCALLGAGDRLELAAGEAGARLLLLAGRPLHEPVVQYGPFVMNSVAEIEQAIMDYRAGKLV